MSHDFPVAARYEWRGWDPEQWRASFTAFERHPRVIDQRYLVNWNNKQARGYRASDSVTYSSTYRSVLLEDRLKRAIRGQRKATLGQAIDIMEVAGTADLRAHAVLPLALKIVGRPGGAAGEAVDQGRRVGGLRRDHDRDGAYDHAEAIRILDAWWPRWIDAQFEPVLGRPALRVLTETVDIDNEPNTGGGHRGSAYQDGWYGYVRKDLRSVLGRKVRGRFSREYCGGGSLKRCRAALRRSLRAALAVPASELYGGDPVCPNADQWCFDAVRFSPVGATSQPLIHWINRPTYQQVNEIQRRLPR